MAHSDKSPSPARIGLHVASHYRVLRETPTGATQPRPSLRPTTSPKCQGQSPLINNYVNYLLLIVRHCNHCYCSELPESSTPVTSDVGQGATVMQLYSTSNPGR